MILGSAERADAQRETLAAVRFGEWLLIPNLGKPVERNTEWPSLSRSTGASQRRSPIISGPNNPGRSIRRAYRMTGTRSGAYTANTAKEIERFFNVKLPGLRLNDSGSASGP